MDSEKTTTSLATGPFLFSLGSRLAYIIAKKYYKNIHFVWCADKYHSESQPASSDPQARFTSLLKDVITGDRHSHMIKDQIAGILRGAAAKLDEGVIDKPTHNKICRYVNSADFNAFYPVLYVIDADAVNGHCEKVKSEESAGEESVEYLIKNLSGDEFQIIDYQKSLSGIVGAYDGLAGE